MNDSQYPHLGGNQTALRQANERLILNTIRRSPVSAAEIARVLGLSSQTVSVILRDLEHDGLIERGEPQRGKVGQPSVPLSLRADGAFFLGLKIGRRSYEMCLTDFHGAIRHRMSQRHRAPTPRGALDFARTAANTLLARLSSPQASRLRGLGIALPARLWDWEPANTPPAQSWNGFDLAAALTRHVDCPVVVENDGTAACRAEWMLGRADLPRDALHVSVGVFVGGGLILDGTVRPGARGGAASIGSLPVLLPDGETAQLLEIASIAELERRLARVGLPQDLYTSSEWDVPESLLDRWTRDAASGLAQAGVAALAIADVSALVIDGWMPGEVRRQLCDATRAAIARLNTAGLEPLAVHEGTIGADGRLLGAAALPMCGRFF